MDIEKLGRYDIIRVLGRGAMGVVYEARDPNLDRPVAIKTIRVQNLSAEATSEYEIRFRIEARSAARLHHPNIVSVFDSGQDGDEAYLVMEFIQGEDLKHHLECGVRFSVRSAIVMVHDLLMALDHAHRQNVVHRDIKPANMLIEASGRVKLTDFGVARIQEPDETHLTQVGGAVGTPKYMSPEQAKGLRGDSRSDVFSAGVVLYELLTGKLPFEGDNQFVIIHQIVSHAPPAPSSLNPDVPVAMDAVIAMAMAKDPDERYATARDFALALRAVAQQLPPSTGTPTTVATDMGHSQVSPIVTVASDAALRDGSSTGIFGSDADESMLSTLNHEAELGAWNAIHNSDDPQDFVQFLSRFPTGIYAKRAQRERDTLLARGQFDADSTMGPFSTAMRLDSDPQDKMAASTPVIVGRRKKWLFAGALSVVAGVAIAIAIFKPSAPASSIDKVVPIQVEEVILPALPASKPELSASAAVVKPAREPLLVASVPVQAASSPASAASRAGKPKSAPASAPLVAPVRPSTSPPANPSATVAPRQPTAVDAAAMNRSVGPSSPGQVCADRVFVFRIACVSEQCVTERYRQSPECIQFREMDRNREERNNRR